MVMEPLTGCRGAANRANDRAVSDSTSVFRSSVRRPGRRPAPAVRAGGPRPLPAATPRIGDARGRVQSEFGQVMYQESFMERRSIRWQQQPRPAPRPRRRPRRSPPSRRRYRGAEQRFNKARRASILLKHVSDPTRLQVILILVRGRAARRRPLRPAQPEPARRQPPPRPAPPRRHHRPPPPGQEQLLQPHRDRHRPRPRGQQPDRLSTSSPRSAGPPRSPIRSRSIADLRSRRSRCRGRGPPAALDPAAAGSIASLGPTPPPLLAPITAGSAGRPPC